MAYYPLPLHHQDAYRDMAKIVGGLENSEELSGRVLSLPMHTELSEEQLHYICKAIKAFYR